ncbi:MAG: hypothetical protein NC489_31025 [Ruminococcus flavefaciens]|nr:hypothetical protein [Ruminococcus flavefaciens]
MPVLAAATGTGLLTEGMKTAFTNGIEGIQSDVTSMIAVALPAGLAIMGIRLAVRLGISFFRSIAG